MSLYGGKIRTAGKFITWTELQFGRSGELEKAGGLAIPEGRLLAFPACKRDACTIEMYNQRDRSVKEMP